MKKILFASTALVAASVVGVGGAQAADKIKIEVGGYSKWWVVGVWQSEQFQNATATGIPLNSNVGNGGTGAVTLGTNGSGQRSNVDVTGENEIHFKGSTALDNGLKVGVFVSLEAGGHGDHTTDTIDQSYVWVEGGFGKIMAGSMANGTALLHVQAPEASMGSAGSTLLVRNFAVNKPSSVMGPNQLVGWSSSANSTAIIVDDNAQKITYVAPSFYGLTVGATYVPNAMRQDLRSTSSSRAGAYGAGAMYTNTFGPVGVKASAGYVYVDVSAGGTAAGVTAFQAHAYGMQLSYAGFTIGASGQIASQDNNGGSAPLTTSLLVAGGDGRAGLVGLSAAKGGAGTSIDFGGKVWDAGIMYASGPYAIGFNYWHSETVGITNSGVGAINNNGKMDTIDHYQVSGKYNVGPGVSLNATVGFGEYKDQRKGTMGVSDAAYENSGWAAMTGLSLAF